MIYLLKVCFVVAIVLGGVAEAQLRSTDFEIWLYNHNTNDILIEVTTVDLV